MNLHTPRLSRRTLAAMAADTTTTGIVGASSLATAAGSDPANGGIEVSDTVTTTVTEMDAVEPAVLEPVPLDVTRSTPVATPSVPVDGWDDCPGCGMG